MTSTTKNQCMILKNMVNQKNSLNFAFLSDILYIRRQDIKDRRNDFAVSQILTHLDISVGRKENALKNFSI